MSEEPSVPVYMRAGDGDEIHVGHITDASNAGLAEFFRAAADEFDQPEQ